jgi:glycosyltransferase involved in cell wall biosynthesis
MYAEALAQRGIHVDVLGLKKYDRKEYEVHNNIHIYRIQKRRVKEKSKFSYFFKIILFLFNSSKWLLQHHRKNPYDIIHVHSVPDFLVFSCIYPKIKGAKIILDIHDILPEFYSSKFSKNNKSFLFKTLLFIEKISCAFADHVIAANHIWQNRLINRSVKSIKCSVILNYPMNNIFNSRISTKKNNKFVMAYPGTLNKHQGLDIAIRAIKRVREKIPHVEFRIIGDGGEKATLIELSKKLKLENEVSFEDTVPLSEIPIVLSDVELGIVPKRNTEFGGEAFSTKTFEFMALGIPIVISDTKIDKYYFDDSLVKFFESGNAEDLAEAIISLYENKSLRETLICNGYQHIKEMSWESKRFDYYTIIDNLLVKN